MQIASVDGTMQSQGLAMSREQNNALEEIIARYDPEEMSDNDMAAMRGELAEAGIGHSREAMGMLNEAGFQPRVEVQSADGRGLQLTDQQKGEFWDLYKQFQTGKISEGEFKTLMQSHMGSGALINYSF